MHFICVGANDAITFSNMKPVWFDQIICRNDICLICSEKGKKMLYKFYIQQKISENLNWKE